MIDYVSTFIFFFAVIDPIGSVPVFIAVTDGYSQRTKHLIAIKCVAISAVILMFFIFAGEIILTAINIPLPAFQIAGGIVLFLFALSMIFGESKPEAEVQLVDDDHTETAIYPLAVPSIAGPGAMLAAVIYTENARYEWTQQLQIGGVMLGVLMIVLVLLLLASYVHRVIGSAGASVISRVMGMLLSALAVSNVLSGLQLYFGI